MKKCPYCFEEIKDEAIVCRYCRHELPGYEEEMNRRKIEASSSVQIEGMNRQTEIIRQEPPPLQDKPEIVPTLTPNDEEINRPSQPVMQESSTQYVKHDDILPQIPIIEASNKPMQTVALTFYGGGQMKKCPYCAKMVQDEAIKCRFCGADLNAISEPKPEKSGGSSVWPVIFLVIIGLCLLIAFLSQFNNSGSSYTSSSSGSSSGSTSSSNSSSGNDTSWFTGGTLHKSTIREWRMATYSNRLATSADFIAATQNVDYGNLVKLKQMATDLEKCISIASSGGDVDNEKVTFVSAICTVELFPK